MKKADLTMRGELIMGWRLLALLLAVDRITCERARMILWVDREDFETACMAMNVLVAHLHKKGITAKIEHGGMPIGYQPEAEIYATGELDHKAVAAYLEVMS